MLRSLQQQQEREQEEILAARFQGQHIGTLGQLGQLGQLGSFAVEMERERVQTRSAGMRSLFVGNVSLTLPSNLSDRF